MADSTFVDFFYPGERDARGIIQFGLDGTIVATIEREAEAIRKSLGPRISDCLLASSVWQAALAASGPAPIVAGGFGQRETVPPTPGDRLSGYRTDDDGVVTHLWLMFGPDSLLFDPTAHQFDDRGGICYLATWLMGHHSSSGAVDGPSSPGLFHRRLGCPNTGAARI